MNSLKETLIVLLIVGALCTAFFFIGKSSKRQVVINDIDTLYITKTDTIKIKVNKLALIRDTIYINSYKDTISYQIAELDTNLAKDSSSVDLNIRYNEYTNIFSVQALFRVHSNTLIIKEYIESPKKEKMLYSHFSVLYDKKNIGIGLSGGFKFKNNYHIGINMNSFGIYGIEFGGEY